MINEYELLSGATKGGVVLTVIEGSDAGETGGIGTIETPFHGAIGYATAVSSRRVTAADFTRAVESRATHVHGQSGVGDATGQSPA